MRLFEAIVLIYSGSFVINSCVILLHTNFSNIAVSSLFSYHCCKGSRK